MSEKLLVLTEDGLISYDALLKEWILKSMISATQSDWNQTDKSASDFIKNKPTSLPASDVPAWAKQSKKPTYTYSEVGAEAAGSVSSHNTSDSAHADIRASIAGVQDTLANKANKSHGNHVPTTETANNAKFLRNDNTWALITPANIGAANAEHTHTIANVDGLQSALGEKVPGTRTVNGKALSANISLTAADVNADASGTANSKVSAHNTNTSAHSDIRSLIAGLTSRLNALADSDDDTLDQMSEVVAYIKSNKSLIEAVTTSKVNVSDIINNLTTNVSNKPLSAAQGVALKGLIDALQKTVDGKANASHDHDLSAMINKLSIKETAPTDADYYVSQYAGGGTTTTTYHRRPVSSLLAYVKSKLAKVATSGSYNDLSDKPTIGNGTITISQNGSTKGTFTLNQTGNTTVTLADTNTWRGIQDNLTSTSTSDSLSANQGRLLANGSARDNTKLPLAGGTVTGRIIRSQGGSWGKDRNNVVVFNSATSENTYVPVVGVKTKDGAWTIGNVGNNENLAFNYTTDTNYNAGTNTSTTAYLPNQGGTIITSASIGEYTSKYATALTTSAGSATTPIYFSSGKPVACSYSLNKTVPSNAVFTDENVRQNAVTASEYSNWRPLIFGESNSTTEGFSPTTTTGKIYSVQTLSVQPSTGTIKATTFKGNLTGDASNALKLGGYSLSAAASNNTVALRTGNGFLYATYFNQSSGTETPTTSSYLIFANSDGFFRKSTLAGVKTILGLGSAAYTNSSAYAAASHNHAASNITSGTLSADRLPIVPISKGGTGATSAGAALSNLGALKAAHKTYTGFGTASTESDGWYTIFQISDSTSGTALCLIKAYAHSSVVFTVTKAYSGTCTMNILDCSSDSVNAAYAYVKALRITNDGTVQAKINTGKTVNFSINIITPNGYIDPVSSLVCDTTSRTVVVERNLKHGKMMANGFIGNLEGNATTSTASDWLNANKDLVYGRNGLNYFNINGTKGTDPKANVTPENGWHYILRMNHPNNSGYFFDIAAPLNSTSGLYWRQVRAGTNYGWYCVLDSNNYTNYAPTKTGSGASGTWGINISGNATTASTATKLATARTISLSGFSSGSAKFDGSGNIEIADWGYSTNKYVTAADTNTPYWRIAYVEASGNYEDRTMVFVIDSGYNGGGFGIVKVAFRSNNISTANQSSCSCIWLVRQGFSADQLFVKGYAPAGGTQYADLYFKANKTYSAVNIRVLTCGGRAGYARAWALASSDTACRAAADIRTYSYTTEGSDGGTANYSNAVLDSQDGNAIKITYAKAGQSTTSWLASWNGRELGAISPSLLSVKYATSAGSATTAGSLNAANTTLSTGHEYSEIKIKGNANGSLGGGNLALRTAIDFKWYGTYWQIGNLRGNSTDSAGFGFAYSADGTTYALKAKITPDGVISATKFSGALEGNATSASTATKATQDSAGQQINKTYIKALSVSGRTITYTRGDGTTGTITTQDTNTTYSLSSFGITATAAELNYTDGVTSNIQTQLNNKAAASHSHSYLPLSGGTMTGNITFTSIGDTATSKGIYWSGSTDGASIYYKTDGADLGRLVLNLTDDTNTRFDFALNGTTKSYIDANGNFSGNANTATTATQLSTSAGSSTQPVYFSGGKPVACSYTLGKSVPSNAVFTDTNTHWTTRIYAGASGAASHAATSNPYIKITDDNTYRNQLRIIGSGATSVSSDASGNITISSTNTTYSSLKNPYSITIQANGTSLGSYDGSSAKTFNITPANIGAVPQCVAVRTTGQDLNNYTTDGWYYFASDYKPSNIPAGSNGWLQVITATLSTGTYCKQLWYRLGTTNSNDFHIFVRTRNTTTWSNWVMVVTNVVTTDMYGTSLPSAGQKGRIFFKKA